MRILLASPGMGLGGAERVVSSLAAGLTDRGHVVAVSGAPGPLDADLTGVERLRLPERGRSPAGAVEWTLREAAFVRSWRPQVVHAHNTKATVIAAAAIRLARGPRRPPLLATHHGAAEDDRAGAARLLARTADEVVCVSEGLVAAFETPPRVIHNGVGPAPAYDAGALDRELALDDRPLVLFLGRLEPVKNPGRFVEVAEQVPEARFVVAGDGSLRDELRSASVTFLGARDDARALLARADLLLVSSDSEGQSIAVLAALAAGTPVVSTPVSGMRELEGVVIADFDPGSLAAAVRELLHDPLRRTSLGAAGAALMLERFSVETMVEAYVRSYLSLLPTIRN